MADELYLTIYCRPPSDEERRDIAELIRPAANLTKTLADIAWAMLASAEFRFNH